MHADPVDCTAQKVTCRLRITPCNLSEMNQLAMRIDRTAQIAPMTPARRKGLIDVPLEIDNVLSGE